MNSFVFISNEFSFQKALPLRTDICCIESLSRIALSKTKNRRRRQVVLPQPKRVASFGQQGFSASGSILQLSEMWKRPFLSWKAICTILHGEIFDQVSIQKYTLAFEDKLIENLNLNRGHTYFNFVTGIA